LANEVRSRNAAWGMVMPQTSRCWVAEGISIDRVIGDRLRDRYKPTLREPVPARFLELLRRADKDFSAPRWANFKASIVGSQR